MENKFTQRFNEALRESGISQNELVKKTGIPKSAISHYKTGRMLPRQDRVYLLSKALKVDPAWLMGFDIPMASEQTYVGQLGNFNVEITIEENATPDTAKAVDRFKRFFAYYKLLGEQEQLAVLTMLESMTKNKDIEKGEMNERIS